MEGEKGCTYQGSEDSKKKRDKWWNVYVTEVQIVTERNVVQFVPEVSVFKGE
jgi:hypothetical protein